MIKQLAVAVATIALAGWVSASSVDWSKALVGANEDGSYTINGSGSFTIVCSFNVADAVALSAFNINNYLLSVSEGTFEVGVTASSSEMRTFYAGEEWGTYSNSDIRDGGLKVGKNTVAITVNREAERETLFRFYLNGETLVSDAGGNFSSMGFYLIGTSYYNSIFNEVIVGVDGNLYYVEGVLSADDIATLPEPTAFALLAFGVVGLVLRRKVA